MEMEQTMVPQIDASNANPNPDAAAMALTGDTATDLQNIAAELGVSVDASGNVVDKAQPQPQSQPAPAPVAAQPANPEPPKPVEVPKKFQNPDGSVNEAAVEKSTKSVEEMIAYYKGKEREAQQLQNKVNNPPQPQTQTQQQPFVPPQGLTPLEIAEVNAILADAQALGKKMSDAEAIIQARSTIRLNEARLNAELAATADLRKEFEESRLTQELQDLLQKDPSFLNPETADSVVTLRNELRKTNPKASYRDAFVLHLGQLELQKRTGQVLTPTPTGTAARPPATPVGPVSRVLPTNVGNPKAMDQNQLLAEIRKIHPNFKG